MRSTQRSFRTFLCLALAAGILCGGTLQGQTMLRWKFKKGEVLNYEVQQNMKMKGAAAGQTIDTTMKMTLNMSWTAQDVDGDGNATVTMSFDRIRVTADLPQGMKMEYDSDSEKEPEGIAAAMATQFKAIVKQPIEMKMSPRGKMSDVKLPETMKKLGAQGGPASEMATAEGMQKLGGLSELPDEAIEPGKTWTSKVTTKTPAGNLNVENKFRYVGKTKEDGKSLEKIAQVTTMKSASGESKLPIEIKKMDGDGTLLFDNSAGHLKSTKIKMKMNMGGDVAGQTIEQNIVIDTSMKLVPASSK